MHRFLACRKWWHHQVHPVHPAKWTVYQGQWAWWFHLGVQVHLLLVLSRCMHLVLTKQIQVLKVPMWMLSLPKLISNFGEFIWLVLVRNVMMVMTDDLLKLCREFCYYIALFGVVSTVFELDPSSLSKWCSRGTCNLHSVCYLEFKVCFSLFFLLLESYNKCRKFVKPEIRLLRNQKIRISYSVCQNLQVGRGFCTKKRISLFPN